MFVTDPDAGHPDIERPMTSSAATAGEAVSAQVRCTMRCDRRLVDITKTMAYKEKAIREHRTQQEREDYVSKFKGLNAYLSLGRGPEVQFCEAFSRR